MLSEQYPHSDRAWAALGLLDARLGSHDRALTELEKALRENPLLPEVQLAYGELLLLENRNAEALEALRSASNLLQDDAQVAARIGQTLLAMGRSAEALDHLRAAVADKPGPPDVERALALALIEADRLSEAERVIDGIPADIEGDSRVLRAYLLMKRDQYAEAETILTELSTRRSNDAGVLNLLGSALYQQAKYGEAVTFLKQAAELEPGTAMFAANQANAEAALAAEQLGTQAQATTRPPSR